MTTFRDQATRIAPPWLRGYWGSRLLWSLMAPFDALLDSVMRAVGVKTPGNDDEADRLLGAERSIPRGPAETAEQYAGRLARWRQAHALRGTPFELLRQLHGFLKDDSGLSLTVQLITNRGDWFQITSGGLEEYILGGASWDGGDWDGETDLWARSWIVIDCAVRYGRTGVWHIGLDREAYSVGSSMPTPVCAGIRAIVRDWSAAHVVNVSIILSFIDSPILAPADWARLGDRDGLFCYLGG